MEADRGQLLAICERVQTDWFQLRAERLGGTVWDDGPLHWTDGPDGQNLMFPRSIPLDAVERGVERARANGHELVGCWVENDTDASPLAELGFERGWSPWWMTASLERISQSIDPRVHLGALPGDVSDEQGGYGRLLELAQIEPDRTFYAAARVDGVLAGHAWSFMSGENAGIFDLDVWPPFRRTGLGAGLLHAVVAAAREAGAKTAIIGTSPQGALIYRAQGFTRIGQGSTWWLELAADSDSAAGAAPELSAAAGSPAV
ncbi:GNAT family N-acetyltransferase [Gryllotalpicola reticulitermitis]|uniref:GNAT family N-acetyltransferase n=1 Tax=Gryllotalpicola reticulitermitis TaxID=1184153 RepID=A0ABV8Q8B3_9MICO